MSWWEDLPLQHPSLTSTTFIQFNGVMAKTRNHGSIDEDAPEPLPPSPSSKRVRHSSSEPKQDTNSLPASTTDEGDFGSPHFPSLKIHLSTGVTDDAVESDSDSDSDSDSSDSEQPSPHGRVPSGIEGFYFPDNYDNPPSPSPSTEHPSGFKGYSFPVCYDNSLPSPSDRVPSGIEGYHFPKYYRIEGRLSSSSSDSDSTVMGSSKITPEEASEKFRKQYHFNNDPDARVRGATIIDLAHSILDKLRGSPTAKNKTSLLQKIARDEPRSGEDDFKNPFIQAILDNARMVLKAGVTPEKTPTIDDFEADPKAWKEDFLGRRCKARFRADSIPQATPPDGSFQKIFDVLPRLQIPEPDLLFGLNDTLLPDEYSSIFESATTKPLCKVIHHPFLACEFKTQNRPIGEARVQCQRDGSAIVSYSAAWNDEVDGKAKAEALEELPKVDFDKHSSTPDPGSICFTVAISPTICFSFVHWREVWSSGAVFYHTSILNTYSLEAGLEAQTERFQRHISNIVDWGVVPRAEKIYAQARIITKRRVGKDDDLPEIHPKRQRTSTADDSD